MRARIPPLLPLLTPRLLLREFCAGDREALRALATDPRVLAYAPHETRALARLERGAAAPARRRSWEFAVIVRRTGKLIGACDLARSGRGTADIGYMVAPRHWGHGYGTEVARRLVEFGFDTLRLRRLSAVVAIENERSRNVLDNAGFSWEALIRRHTRSSGHWWDCHLYVVDRPRGTHDPRPCAPPRRTGS